MPKSASEALMPDISAKSSKNEILAAYNQALARLAEKQDDTATVVVLRKQQENILQEATKATSKPILEELGQLKIKLLKEVDQLTDSLTREMQTLTTTRDAIKIEQQRLEELYQIQQKANTLEALLKAHKDEQEVFTQKQTQQIQEGQQKIIQLENEYREKREQLEKTSKREEEEYIYNTELSRRKEQDAYLTKKLQLEKELFEQKEALNKREQSIAEQEKLLANLQAQVAMFDQSMAKEVAQAESTLKAKLEHDHRFALELAKKEAESQQKLLEQKIIYLEAKIKEQTQLIGQLTSKSDEASAQVQAIACRALDTSAQRFAYTTKEKEEI